MNVQLLCMFTNIDELDDSIDFVIKNYKLINPNVFVLENTANGRDLYITFNVKKGDSAVSSKWKTILVHRKKESNTIYTINALNEIVKSKTGGQTDNTFVIDWSEYQNSIITTSAGGYKQIPTKIYDMFKSEQ